MTGCPSSYTDEIAAEICERLVTTDGGLVEVCEADDMPSDRTVYRWLADERNEAFRQMYARTRELAGDYQAQKGLKEALNAKDAALGRLAWDARRWHAEKLGARVYGAKTQVDHTNSDGSMKPASEAETAARIAAIMAEAVRAREAKGGE